MTKVISIFNNKGGVGKSTICWNIADSLGEKGKNVLLIDFDPQCNLSIAMLNEPQSALPVEEGDNTYSKTIRSFLQPFLLNRNNKKVYIHRGDGTSNNVYLVSGDFWLNVYADSLNVGSDLLSGTGLSRYAVIRDIIKGAEEEAKIQFDFVLIDLPPSFGSLVRSAFYCSDYFLVPCTSDKFSAYCVGLIGKMIPTFIADWGLGMDRYKNNSGDTNDFNELGRPKFAGWIFNGFDTSRKRRNGVEIAHKAEMNEKKKMVADEAMRKILSDSIISNLVPNLKNNITKYNPIAIGLNNDDYLVGEIEDANVLIQNSLLLNCPLSKLCDKKPVGKLLNKRTKWAANQVDQINEFKDKFGSLADKIEQICI